MAIYIDTSRCERISLSDAQGDIAEIMNRSLCGAENGAGMLRWLGAGDRFSAAAAGKNHQLIYLMEGSGVINLEDEDYEVAQGAGIYLGPGETASIRHAGAATLKLFHLVVPEKTGD